MANLASLHAGLIERTPQVPEPTGVLKLRARNMPPPKVSGPVDLPQVQHLDKRPLVHGAPPRRFGLTLRVEPEMRRDLARYTDYTGRTTQSVLHAALSGYLDRANEILQHKE